MGHFAQSRQTSPRYYYNNRVAAANQPIRSLAKRELDAVGVCAIVIESARGPFKLRAETVPRWSTSMKRVACRPKAIRTLGVVVAVLLVWVAPRAFPDDGQTAYRLKLEAGHPRRAPFRLDRVGQPITTVIEATGRPSTANYGVEAFSKGRLVGSQAVHFPEKAPYAARVTLAGFVSADELVFSARAGNASNAVELAREKLRLPEIEADAVAISDPIVNPVDLGTILVPAGWLLLGPGQKATLEIAALTRGHDLPGRGSRRGSTRRPSAWRAAPFPSARANRNDSHSNLPNRHRPETATS